ncbi:uncharacterized protein LOC144294259 [Canis aureus]
MDRKQESGRVQSAALGGPQRSRCAAARSPAAARPVEWGLQTEGRAGTSSRPAEEKRAGPTLRRFSGKFSAPRPAPPRSRWPSGGPGPGLARVRATGRHLHPPGCGKARGRVAQSGRGGGGTHAEWPGWSRSVAGVTGGGRAQATASRGAGGTCRSAAPRVDEGAAGSEAGARVVSRWGRGAGAPGQTSGRSGVSCRLPLSPGGRTLLAAEGLVSESGSAWPSRRGRSPARGWAPWLPSSPRRLLQRQLLPASPSPGTSSQRGGPCPELGSFRAASLRQNVRGSRGARGPSPAAAPSPEAPKPHRGRACGSGSPRRPEDPPDRRKRGTPWGAGRELQGLDGRLGVGRLLSRPRLHRAFASTRRRARNLPETGRLSPATALRKHVVGFSRSVEVTPSKQRVCGATLVIPKTPRVLSQDVN